MNLSRRQFLKSGAVLSSIALLSRMPAFSVRAEAVDYVEMYLTALETPFAAPLNTHFEGVIQGDSVGLLLFDLTHGRLVTALSPENLLPAASAFKGPLLMYFVDQVDESVWNSVPVAYWNANIGEVPEEYRADWQQHQAIFRSLYQTIVISDNQATGEVLSYVARLKGSDNPIVLFNDWALKTVGMSQLSGLSAWNQGVASDMYFTDERYANMETTIHSQLVVFDNMMTPRDLGLFYVWMLTRMTDDQQRVCKALLSTIYDDRGANLEDLATERGGIPYSKNGSLNTESGYVVTDAGLIELPGNQLYLLVMESIHNANSGTVSVLPTLFEELGKTLDGQYNELIHNHHFNAVGAEELLAIYMAQVSQAYDQTGDDDDGLYHYGFILPEGVAIYSQPDRDHPLHNPIIKSTRFGVHLLMQGALVRFVDAGHDWVELMPDDDRDNVRVRLGTRVFVRRTDVWPISLAYAQPVPYLTDSTVSAADKSIIILVATRELFLFEGATPILRIPIVLNSDATPRGVQVITSKWLARSMQPWAPGVPFTSFFGGDGFALHGSPWQRWSTTVNQETIGGRTSAGCVNVPDWMVTVGDITRPADELLFRWIGGMENPRDQIFEYPSEAYPALRIFNVDYANNLRNYSLSAGMAARGASWDTVIEAMNATPLQAPESFFV